MRKVGEGIYAVGGYVNAYIVDGDQGVTLIDTGMPKKDGPIRDALEVLGRRPSDVAAIILTHSHNDHTGGAAVLKELTGAQLIAPAIDRPAIEGRAPVPAPPIIPDWLAFVTRVMPAALPVAVDLAVSEAGQQGMPDDFAVIDTPGHSPGHTSYLLDRDGGVLFVGDAAVVDKSGAVVPGFFNRGGGQSIVESIQHLATFDFETALFGHSDPIGSDAASVFRSSRSS